ncbi:hypothetical protein [Desulfuromonas thiophila]|uniref:FlgN protein n=1 Tax=Desulfuromonas thiophila TaxID=57664 RepID=A0A1G7EZT9_9BACT|nr:hypothetical protein [Desulfuromonas thiophila]SDE69154.1 hypothetical protein SAMN05661003_12516 [Desulfuromonas thiophila]
MSDPLTEELQKTLQASLTRYLAMEALLQRLEAALAGPEEALPPLVVELSQAQRILEREEEPVAVLLQQGAALVQHPLARQRQAAMARVLELNRLLLPRINGMMALLSHELKELRDGRTGISGYRSTGASARRERITA